MLAWPYNAVKNSADLTRIVILSRVMPPTMRRRFKRKSRGLAALPKGNLRRQFTVWRLSVFFASTLLAAVVGCGDRPAADSPTNVDASAPPSSSRPLSAKTTPLELGDAFAPLADVVATVDPRQDQGWESEAFSELAQSRLAALEVAVRDPSQRTTEKLAELATDDFHCNELRPTTKEVFRDGAIVVHRATNPDVRIASANASVPAGSAALAAGLRSLSAAYDDVAHADVHFKFKTIRVELAGDSARTTSYFQAVGHVAGGLVQQNATWRCRWKLAEGQPPKLAEISAANYEEIRPAAAKARQFVDCTQAVLGGTESFRRQLALGADHWHANLDAAFGVSQHNHGVAVGDANGDGLDDVYVCQPSGMPNLLYLQQVDGTLADVSAQSGVDWLDISRAALFVDLDNDGDQDLVLTLRWSMLIHENDGRGRFALKRIVDTKFNLHSIAAADYDRDGNIDLYICGYSPGPESAATDVFANPVPYNDANNGGRNFLLRNEGQLDFSDVTEQVGLEQNNRRFSFAASWEDFDNDGDLDIYVANDFGRNNLYRSDDGRFVDIAAEVGVEDIAAGMSVSWADYDHDGRMDVYVGNMFSSAGNRIAFQRNFRPGADEDTLGQLRRHARGNTLFRNVGGGAFDDVSSDAAVTMGRWAWASLFTDINNDGWEDLYVTNGFFTTEDNGDL